MVVLLIPCLYEFISEKCDGPNDINNIVCKFRNHSSIMKIKESYSITGNFSFNLVSTVEKKIISKDFSANKVARFEIPIKILKKSAFWFDKLADHEIYALTNVKFPSILRNEDVASALKRNDTTDKLPSTQSSTLIKVLERIIYKIAFLEGPRLDPKKMLILKQFLKTSRNFMSSWLPNQC